MQTVTCSVQIYAQRNQVFILGMHERTSVKVAKTAPADHYAENRKCGYQYLNG